MCREGETTCQPGPVSRAVSSFEAWSSIDARDGAAAGIYTHA